MVAAGFSGGEADQLRRAMPNWHKDGELYKFHGKFIGGMLQRGYPRELAERLWLVWLLAALARRHLNSMLAVWREYAMEPGQIKSWLGYWRPC